MCSGRAELPFYFARTWKHRVHCEFVKLGRGGGVLVWGVFTHSMSIFRRLLQDEE
jgi:hypothetical protein